MSARRCTVKTPGRGSTGTPALVAVEAVHLALVGTLLGAALGAGYAWVGVNPLLSEFTSAPLVLTPLRLDVVLFEVISAFGTVGMSTGITADIPPAGQLILVAMMFLGRLGPITLGAALALRNRPRRFEVPEERILVG